MQTYRLLGVFLPFFPYLTTTFWFILCTEHLFLNIQLFFLQPFRRNQVLVFFFSSVVFKIYWIHLCRFWNFSNFFTFIFLFLLLCFYFFFVFFPSKTTKNVFKKNMKNRKIFSKNLFSRLDKILFFAEQIFSNFSKFCEICDN